MPAAVLQQSSASKKATIRNTLATGAQKQQILEGSTQEDYSPVKLNKKGKRIGRWSPEEHERFLEALRIYAKDWTMIEMHVKTRDVTNIRAHAQKFLLKLVKLLDKDENDLSSKDTGRGGVPLASAITSAGIGNNDEEPMTTEQASNAEIYYQILKQKMHKSFSKTLKENLKKKEKEANLKINKQVEQVADEA